jgi:hypothetical protein
MIEAKTGKPLRLQGKKDRLQMLFVSSFCIVLIACEEVVSVATVSTASSLLYTVSGFCQELRRSKLTYKPVHGISERPSKNIS